MCCVWRRRARRSCLNSPYGPDEVWDHLPRAMQQRMIALKLRFFVIDASEVARDVGLGGRTNTVLQTCFFAISGVLPHDKAISHIKESIRKTYGRRARMSCEEFPGGRRHIGAAVRGSSPARRHQSLRASRRSCPRSARFVREVTARMMDGLGDDIPVSLMPVDGTFPSGTAAFEKRNIAEQVPVWEQDLCVQCGQCSFVCPHSVIRAKYYDETSWPGRRTVSNPRRSMRAAIRKRVLPCSSMSRIAPAAALRRGVPGEQPARGRRQGDQHAR